MHACAPAGEVLEEEEYMRRKEYYLGVGQRHYYFMNIGNGECIDACRKVRRGFVVWWRPGRSSGRRSHTVACAATHLPLQVETAAQGCPP